jgi:hypothetical protein
MVENVENHGSVENRFLIARQKERPEGQVYSFHLFLDPYHSSNCISKVVTKGR